MTKTGDAPHKTIIRTGLFFRTALIHGYGIDGTVYYHVGVVNYRVGVVYCRVGVVISLMGVMDFDADDRVRKKK